MRTCKEYRLFAENILKNNYCTMIIMSLLYGAILSACIGSILLGILLDGAMMVGLCIANMKLVRGEKVKIKDLFSAFDDCDITSTIGLSIKTGIFTFLWGLLLVVPGIIASYAYSMAPYIMADRPELTGGEAIALSKRLMKGKKRKLFLLDLSYAGWILLGILTLGILLIWVIPRMDAARAAFYEDIRHELPAEA